MLTPKRWGPSQMSSIVTEIRPPESASALVRKLGALTLLSETEIDFLESIQNNKVHVSAKQDFIEEGDDLQATYLVTGGWAIRYIMTEDGRRQILSFALPGDILGLHVNFRRTASYSAAALSDLDLAVIDPMRTIEISQNYPVLSAGLSWCTAREFGILGHQALRLGRLTAYERLAHLLLELWYRLRLIGETEGSSLEMPMTQSELADALGLSDVHTNRQLQKMKRDGLISLNKDWLTLNDIDKLTDIAEFDAEHLAEFRLQGRPQSKSS